MMAAVAEMLTASDVAKLAGIKPASFAVARARGVAPDPDAYDDEGHPLWYAETVEPWLTTRRRRNGLRVGVQLRPAPPSVRKADPVGVVDIAERCGRSVKTVEWWARDGDMPPARWTVSGQRVWDWGDLIPWLSATRRLPSA